MFKRIAGALIAATLCSAMPILADPLPAVYLERFSGTYSTDCDDMQADRLTILVDKLIFTSGDDELVAKDILTNMSYWGRMPPDGFEIALLAGFEADTSLVFLIHSDEQGIYILLEEDTTSDDEARYYKCECGKVQHATPVR